MRQPLIIIISLVTLLIVTGCAQQPTGKAKYQTSPYLSVHFDPFLSLIKVGDQKVRLKGGLRQFHADIVNISNMKEKLSYQFKFYDKDGFELPGDKTPWLPLTIAPYETLSIQKVAPSKAVFTSRLFIQKER